MFDVLQYILLGEILLRETLECGLPKKEKYSIAANLLPYSIDCCLYCDFFVNYFQAKRQGVNSSAKLGLPV